MKRIESTNLGRTIWVASSDKERSHLLGEEVPESNIYTEAEMKAMRGISLEGLRAVQSIKDVFPGAEFERYEMVAQKPAPAPVIPSSTTKQLSLL